MNKFAKIVLWVAGLALYLNIGWAIGTWTHNIFGNDVEWTTISQKVISGPGEVNIIDSGDNTSTMLSNQVTSMFLWPFLFVIVAVEWIGYGIYLFLWFIFAGGGAKLLGYG